MLAQNIRFLMRFSLILSLLWLIPTAPLLPLPLAAAPADEDALVATSWFTLYGSLIQTTEGFTPPVAARAIGYAGVTLYEAVVHSMPEYQSLAGELNGLTTLPQPVSTRRYHWPTVANSALATITRALFSNTSPENKAAMSLLEGQLAERYRHTLDSATFARSVQFGRTLAVALYTWAMKDGGHEGQLRNFPADYQPAKGPGAWVPTPPDFAPIPLQPTWGNNRRFLPDHGQSCTPTPVIPYSEEEDADFYRQAQEVYDTVRLLTPEQRIIALYWADDPGYTATPPGHSLALTTQILQREQASLSLAAETYAKVGMALSDAFVSCWQLKYLYNRIRPISYIQLVIDPLWNTPTVTDPVATPPFPEYTSGHSVQSGAVAEVLTALFGDQYAFTDHTHDRRGFLPRPFASFWAMANEAAVSRLYGGIHFRDAIEDGLEQGRCIGQQVLALPFRR
jgi:hypothetical protein